MKITIDDREIAVPDDMVERIFLDIWIELEDTYHELDDTIRFGMKMFIRQFLKNLEKQYGTSIRPPKGDDPVMHFMSLIFDFSMEVAKRYASVEVTTSGPQHTDADTLSVTIESEGKSWRQVVDMRNYGMREDNLLKEAVSTPHEVVS